MNKNFLNRLIEAALYILLWAAWAIVLTSIAEQRRVMHTSYALKEVVVLALITLPTTYLALLGAKLLCHHGEGRPNLPFLQRQYFFSSQ
jgi:hypothetical protein